QAVTPIEQNIGRFCRTWVCCVDHERQQRAESDCAVPKPMLINASISASVRQLYPVVLKRSTNGLPKQL
ncbi:MAG: hypothetical protein JJU24_13700, partial [Natronohydrobacter sp.]|nr:hypothetical protein [Natronohydrobacter sp.]